MPGRQPTICPVVGENPTGGWAGGKVEEGLFSSVKHSSTPGPFKARELGPALVSFQLPCLLCIIDSGVPLQGKVLCYPAQDLPMAPPLYG